MRHDQLAPDLIGDGSGSIIYGPDGLPVEQVKSGGDAVFYHHDRQGSTRLLTDSSGDSVGAFTYDAYGQTTAASGAAKTHFGYDGQYTDPTTGHEDLRARQYDPETAQFTSRDPLGQLTRQPYAYASNDPIDFADPSGLWLGVPWLASPGDVIGAAGSTAATVLQYTPPGQLLQATSSLTGLTIGGCIGGEAGIVFVSNVHICYAATPNGHSCLAFTYGATNGAALGASANARPPTRTHAADRADLEDHSRAAAAPSAQFQGHSCAAPVGSGRRRQEDRIRSKRSRLTEVGEEPPTPGQPRVMACD
jgi:RHS repeat-associated protein